MFRRKPRLGLALSGGGARGLAHIGVLKVLEQEGIKPAYIAGTSMGGVIATAYAFGLNSAQMEEEALKLSKLSSILSFFVDPSLPWKGLIEGKKIKDYFYKWVGDATFAEARIPLALVAVDLKSGEEVVMQEGKVVDALRATISVPGIFTPYTCNGKILVDGGVLNNLPADVVRQMGAEVVIAVDVAVELNQLDWKQPRLPFSQIPEVFAALWRTVEVMEKEIRTRRLREARPDVLIKPRLDRDITVLTGFNRVADIIKAGEDAAYEHLPRIRNLLRPRFFLRRKW